MLAQPSPQNVVMAYLRSSPGCPCFASSSKEVERVIFKPAKQVNPTSGTKQKPCIGRWVGGGGGVEIRSFHASTNTNTKTNAHIVSRAHLLHFRDPQSLLEPRKMHPRPFPSLRAPASTHTRTHTHAHTRTHTRTHAHTHTHTYKRSTSCEKKRCCRACPKEPRRKRLYLSIFIINDCAGRDQHKLGLCIGTHHEVASSLVAQLAHHRRRDVL